MAVLVGGVWRREWWLGATGARDKQLAAVYLCKAVGGGMGDTWGGSQ